MQTAGRDGKRLAAVAFLALCMMGLLSACGGGDANQPAVLTKAQLIARADKVCAKTEQRQVELVGEFAERGASKDKAGEEDLIRFAGLPPMQNELQALQALAEQSDNQAFDAYLESFEAAVERVDREPGALLERGQTVFDESEQLAKRAGLKVCGGS